MVAKAKYIVFSLIITTIVLIGCNSKEVTNNFLITINSDRDIYKEGNLINIEVTIENLSPDKVVLRALPLFEIFSEQLKHRIWSAVKFSNNNQNLKANEKDQLVLLPQEKRKFKYTLNKLKWEYKIFSFWPSKKLSAFIGSGVYTVIFTLQGTINNRPSTLTSNAVTIKVK